MILSKPLDSAVVIVYDVFIIVFMIMTCLRKKNPRLFRILLYSYYMEILVKQNEINLDLILLKVKMCFFSS